jgi:hypothetical protein
MLFTVTCVLSVIGYKYNKSISRSWDKYCAVVRMYKTRYPDMYKVTANLKAIELIIRTKLLLFYQWMTSLNCSSFYLTKYVMGGQYYFHVIKIKKGPGKNIEYGFIDNIDRTELIQRLAGINCDFSGQPDILFEFGNSIRYKIDNQDEIQMEKLGNEDIKKENLKKIFNF